MIAATMDKKYMFWRLQPFASINSAYPDMSEPTLWLKVKRALLLSLEHSHLVPVGSAGFCGFRRKELGPHSDFRRTLRSSGTSGQLLSGQIWPSARECQLCCLDLSLDCSFGGFSALKIFEV